MLCPAVINRRRFSLLLTLPALASVALAEVPSIRMFELYGDKLAFSATAKRLNGTIVRMQGFMAPHLKVESDFFVLSNSPVETCPFCESEDKWIDSIIFVRMKKRQAAAHPGTLIQVAGRLDIGPHTDTATGFVSRVRLLDASYKVL